VVLCANRSGVVEEAAVGDGGIDDRLVPPTGIGIGGPAEVECLIAGFLLGHRGHTRAAYLADLKDFAGWCVAGGVELPAVDRADVEAYARDLEQAGRARSTVARRLATLAGFYHYAVEEVALPRSPVAHVRRPSVARDSQTLGLDRDEAARFLAAAETASTGDHALACLLMLNGLRVSEACAADVADLGIERAHRVLAVSLAG
jgi:integrase/recombinase XerD